MQTSEIWVFAFLGWTVRFVRLPLHAARFFVTLLLLT